MNQQQRKYALERVDGIAKAKIEKATAELTKPAKTLTPAERAELIRSGKVKVRTDIKEVWPRTDAADVFDFKKHEWPASIDTKRLEAVSSAIRASAATVKDAIMLGDAAEALEKLEAFSAVSLPANVE